MKVARRNWDGCEEEASFTWDILSANTADGSDEHFALQIILELSFLNVSIN